MLLHHCSYRNYCVLKDDLCASQKGVGCCEWRRGPHTGTQTHRQDCHLYSGQCSVRTWMKCSNNMLIRSLLVHVFIWMGWIGIFCKAAIVFQYTSTSPLRTATACWPAGTTSCCASMISATPKQVTAEHVGEKFAHAKRHVGTCRIWFNWWGLKHVSPVGFSVNSALVCETLPPTGDRSHLQTGACESLWCSGNCKKGEA